MKDKSTIKIVYHVTHVCISLVYCKFGLHDKSHVGFIKSLFKKKKKHLKVSFAISVWDTDVAQTCALCYYVIYPDLYSLLRGCVWAFFDKSPLLSISVRTWFESKSTSAYTLRWFNLNTHCFISISVSKKVQNTDIDWNNLQQPLKNYIFKTSVK